MTAAYALGCSAGNFAAGEAFELGCKCNAWGRYRYGIGGNSACICNGDKEDAETVKINENFIKSLEFL